MSSPRHLWSGDWELDSSAARDELRRRQPVEETALSEPGAAPARPSLLSRMVAALLRTYDVRAALLVAVAVLFTAAAGYGIAALVVGGGGSSPPASGRAHAWLGIDVSGSPQGIVVTDVASGSPAQSAGLLPGDLITAIDSQPVGTVDSVSAVLATLHPGNTVAIQFSRGLVSYTTQATLAKGPFAGP